jgi:hypothetical protein
VALVVAVLVGALLVGGIAAALIRFASGSETTTGGETAGGSTSTATRATTAASLTPFDEALLGYVPDAIRPTCRHAPPLSDEFDATVLCRPGGVVGFLSYSHARSGQYLYEFMDARRARVGLLEAAAAGSCRTQVVPSLNDTIAVGFRGRAESEPVTKEQRLGRILCVRNGDRGRLEWLTREVAIYAIARSNDLGALYHWWETDAGPEP